MRLFTRPAENARGWITQDDIVRRLAKTILRGLPDKIPHYILMRSARAHPSFKTRTFERVCSMMAHTIFGGTKEVVVTNFGISARLRCQIPIAKTSYAFGKPENGLGERSTLALVEALLKDCRHFLDVGANEGVFTFVVAAADSEQRVVMHWFEPDEDLYSRLCANLQANNIQTRCNKTAVSDKRGAAVFLKNLADDASGSLVDYFAAKHPTTPRTVETIRLSDYFDENNIQDALVKVDVEGAGVGVWSGAVEVADRITYLVMEMLAPEIEKNLPYQIITESGMHAYYIRDFDLVVSRDGRYRYVEPFLNWLFCRLDADSLAARLHDSPFQVVTSDQ